MDLVKVFKRKTSSKFFLSEIDGLRFFSIFTVILFHLNTFLISNLNVDALDLYETDSIFDFGWWIIRMDLGVKYFFVISGFILSIPFLKNLFFNGKKISLKDYYIRRLIRLEPPYVITLSVLFFGQILFLDIPFETLYKSFFASLFYLHLIIFEINPLINPVAWSLEIEAQFYFILPLLFFVLKNNKKLFLYIFLSIFIFSFWIKDNNIEFFNIKSSNTVFGYLINFVEFLFPPFLTKDSSKQILYYIIGLISFFGVFYFINHNHIQYTFYFQLVFIFKFYMFFYELF